MTTLVFDIETIPDLENGKQLLAIKDAVDDTQLARIMESHRLKETEGKSHFQRHFLHRVVAISVVVHDDNHLDCYSLGDVDSNEKDIIQNFFALLEQYQPRLVSWNGRGFDLPVLNYRSLFHLIEAPIYWEKGMRIREFKWNHYQSRYHNRHIDLMDILAGYDSRAIAPLHHIAVMLKLPGKMGLTGSDVLDRYLSGETDAIRKYCEIDTLNTYLIYLNYLVISGTLNKKQLETEQRRVVELIRTKNQSHFNDFLDAWQSKPISAE